MRCQQSVGDLCAEGLGIFQAGAVAGRGIDSIFQLGKGTGLLEGMNDIQRDYNIGVSVGLRVVCLLYTSPSPRD